MESLINRWKNANSLRKSTAKTSRENSAEPKNLIRENLSGSKARKDVSPDSLSSSEDDRDHLKKSAQR